MTTKLTSAQVAERRRQFELTVSRIGDPRRTIKQRVAAVEEATKFLAGLAPLVDQVRHLQHALTLVQIPAGGFQD